ncbi:MAG: lipopolysaccharide core biosynthesis protein [Verrucomicrobia bacterium]|nr:lipopolysaccharide core biosynthesis protein [Verrucomicrobiota bacterium]
MRILILRGGALGDLIVTLPAIAALRARWREARIELVGNVTAAELALERGLINAAHSQHESRWSALYGSAALPAELARWFEAFDLVVSYWPDPEQELARRFPLRADQIFLTTSAHPEMGPAALHYLTALRDLGVIPADLLVSTFNLQPRSNGGVTPSSRSGVAASVSEWIGVRPRTDAVRDEGVAAPFQARPSLVYPLRTPHPDKGSIALHPGSGSRRKNWPIDRWTTLAKWLEAQSRFKVLVISGEAESRNLLEGIGEHFHSRPLGEVADRLARCRLFIGHDSGISHLAASTGVPCVLLFGPTDPAIWAPPSPTVRVIRSGADL